MGKKCVKLWYNFVQFNNGQEAGEDYSVHEVGSLGVTSIERHVTQVHNYYTVEFEDGSMEEIYNPNRTFYVEDV